MAPAPPDTDVPSSGRSALFVRRLAGNPTALMSGAVLLVLIAVAIAAPLIAPHDPYAQDLAARLKPPIPFAGSDPAHPLGTDPFGRDYLSRLIYGTRIPLVVGFSVMLISGLIGTTLGLVAGYFGGRIDQAIMFVINTRLALPIFLVAMSVVVVFGASLTGLILVLGLFLWDRFVVVVRSGTQQAASQDYVVAARSIGCSNAYILLGEILPNMINPIIVIGTLEMANGILVGAALSFLGFGVQEPIPDWGLMLAQARQYMFFDAWLLYIPGGALFVLVLAINLFGDRLRDLLSVEESA
jgi:peptide/nickel transport system permease protein